MRLTLAASFSFALFASAFSEQALADHLPPPPDAVPAAAASPAATASPVVALPPASSSGGAANGAADARPGTAVAGTGIASSSTTATLREIGRVRVSTPFCTALRNSTAPGAEAAVAFEGSSLVTLADIIRLGHADNGLMKDRLDRQVQDDLRNLADQSRAGNTELGDLKALAETSTPERAAEVLALKNALLGAKARQHTYVRTLALYAARAGQAEIDIEHEFDPKLVRFLETIGTQQGGISLEAPAALEAELPDEEISRIRLDLDGAALHAQNAMTLGNCAAPASDAQPPTAPVPSV